MTTAAPSWSRAAGGWSRGSGPGCTSRSWTAGSGRSGRPTRRWSRRRIGCTISADGTDLRQLTDDDAPTDGCEYSPDAEWILFNTERFDGHAQVARIRTDGTGLEQLTFDERVNWFPHIAPTGTHAYYLAYPAGTTGHPADRDVEVRLVEGDGWDEVTTVTRFNGGQGTMNVNGWDPTGTRFAVVAYPR